MKISQHAVYADHRRNRFVGCGLARAPISPAQFVRGCFGGGARAGLFGIHPRNTGATPTKEAGVFRPCARQQMDNLERRYGGNQPEGIRFGPCRRTITAFAGACVLDVMQQVDAGRYDLMLNETPNVADKSKMATNCELVYGRDVSSRVRTKAQWGVCLSDTSWNSSSCSRRCRTCSYAADIRLRRAKACRLRICCRIRSCRLCRVVRVGSVFEEPLWAPSKKTVKVSDRGFATSYMLHSDAYTITSGIYPNSWGREVLSRQFPFARVSTCILAMCASRGAWLARWGSCSWWP